jgi:ketosteroid isomerase-like protein
VSIRISNAFVMLALVVAVSCRIEPTPGVDADDPANVARAEIELTLRNYQEFVIAGDARRAAALFTPGAHLYLPDAPAITGRGAIDSTMADQFARESVIDMAIDFDAIDVGTGAAHQFGTMHQRIRDAEGEERQIDGRFAIRWLRAADSAWRIDRLLVNHAPAEPAPVARP